MKVSNKTKRNINFTLIFIGIACIIARTLNVISDPESGKAWFELFGIIVLTYICYDSFMTYHRRVKNGIASGDH